MQAQGLKVAVASSEIPLSTDGLTGIQAARALRHALNLYAREGAAGVSASGLTLGLAAHLAQAGAQSTALRRAIEAGNFGVAYQPIVALRDRALHHYEALIRPNPVPGVPLAGPQEFVMLVETLGLAPELDLVIGSRVCEAAAAAGARLAFNISSLSTQNPAFRERLVGMLGQSPAVKAGLISIELTETAELQDMTEAALTAEALRGLGVPFCLDDFGAGTADVRLLRALGADIVKIDGSYVRGIAAAERERAFVAGIVEIARAASAETVAEQVETEADAEALLSIGVTYGQGWLFGRPAPLGGSTPAAPVRPARRRGATESWG